MSDRSQLVTPALLEAWVSEASTKQLRLHQQATDPAMFSREQAFILMSEVLREAIEKVRAAAITIKERDKRMQQGL